MKVWWTCVYKLQSSVILKDWLCTFIEVVNLMVMFKERRRFWPGKHTPPPPSTPFPNQKKNIRNNTQHPDKYWVRLCPLESTLRPK